MIRKLALAAALVLAVAAAASAAGSHRVYLPACTATAKASYKPHRVVLACADANAFVKRIQWSHWGADRAHGHGTARVNDCNPSCAQGTFHSYPVRLTATRPRRCSSGKREWKRLRYVFPKKRPAGYAKRNSEKRPCSA